jgi:PilZ domain
MRSRRRQERVTLLTALRGATGEQRIFIKNVSLDGLLVAHQQPLGRPGNEVRIAFSWDGHDITVRAELRWSHVQRIGTGSYAKTLYHSGCRITLMDESSRAALKGIVAEHVLRALDEQKANARGIPPQAVVAVQTGLATTYVRHELREHVWHAIATPSPEQPTNGFTVASDLTDDEVALLRDAYARGDASARAFLRQTAALSISNKDGIPIRRYTP